MSNESSELSAVAKALAFQPPYQASLAKRVECLIESREAYKNEIEWLRRNGGILADILETVCGNQNPEVNEAIAAWRKETSGKGDRNDG